MNENGESDDEGNLKIVLESPELDKPKQNAKKRRSKSPNKKLTNRKKRIMSKLKML